MAKSDEPITIKKYANRRLYNTGTSTYVTLEDLATMVKSGEDFVVYRRQDQRGHHPLGADADHLRAGEQGRRQNLLPINFLRQLIRFYGDSMQMLVPRYLEVSIDSLTREQEKFREQMAQAFGMGGFGAHRGAGAPEHGNVRARLRDVHAVRAAGQSDEAQPSRTRPRSRPRQSPPAATSTNSSARSTRCRSASIALGDKDK